MHIAIDLSQISLETYQRILMQQTLLPSRKLLHEQLTERFAALQSAGITQLNALRLQLATPQKCAALAAATGVPQAYLVLLKREIGALLPKPIPLAELMPADSVAIAKLTSAGIKRNTDVLLHIQTTVGLAQLREACGMDADAFSKLVSLCELTALNGVGAAAAKNLLAAGYHHVQAIADADAATLLADMAAANAKGQYYAATLGQKDAQFLIDTAKRALQLSQDSGK